jgi:hypothetical protein
MRGLLTSKGFVFCGFRNFLAVPGLATNRYRIRAYVLELVKNDKKSFFAFSFLRTATVLQALWGLAQAALKTRGLGVTALVAAARNFLAYMN